MSPDIRVLERLRRWISTRALAALLLPVVFAIVEVLFQVGRQESGPAGKIACHDPASSDHFEDGAPVDAEDGPRLGDREHRFKWEPLELQELPEPGVTLFGGKGKRHSV